MHTFDNATPYIRHQRDHYNVPVHPSIRRVHAWYGRYIYKRRSVQDLVNQLILTFLVSLSCKKCCWCSLVLCRFGHHANISFRGGRKSSRPTRMLSSTS